MPPSSAGMPWRREVAGGERRQRRPHVGRPGGTPGGRRPAAQKQNNPGALCSVPRSFVLATGLARKWIPYKDSSAEWPDRALPRIDRGEYGVGCASGLRGCEGIVPLLPCDSALTLVFVDPPFARLPCGLAALGDHAGARARWPSLSRPTVTLDGAVRAARARRFAPTRAVRTHCPGLRGPRRHGGRMETCAFIRAGTCVPLALVDFALLVRVEHNLYLPCDFFRAAVAGPLAKVPRSPRCRCRLACARKNRSKPPLPGIPRASQGDLSWDFQRSPSTDMPRGFLLPVPAALRLLALRPARAWTMLPSDQTTRITPELSARILVLRRRVRSSACRPRRFHGLGGLSAGCQHVAAGASHGVRPVSVLSFLTRLSPKRPVIPASPTCVGAAGPADYATCVATPDSRGRQHVPVPRSCPAKLFSPTVAATECALDCSSRFPDRWGASPRHWENRFQLSTCRVHRDPCLLVLRKSCRLLLAQRARGLRAPQGFAPPPELFQLPDIAAGKWTLLPWACRYGSAPTSPRLPANRPVRFGFAACAATRDRPPRVATREGSAARCSPERERRKGA